jgi:hypothetical protein
LRRVRKMSWPISGNGKRFAAYGYTKRIHKTPLIKGEGEKWLQIW